MYKYTNEFLAKNIGIYKITFNNSENNKCYIGSALENTNKMPSRNGFYVRWKKHMRDLKANRHHSIKLQNAFNKYGEENINFEIIDILKPNYHKNYYYQIETGYILKNKALEGYNIVLKAGSRKGMKNSEQSKKIISIKNSGIGNGMYGRRGINCPNSKEVFQYTMNGEYIDKFSSATEAANFYNTNNVNIDSAARGERKSSKNFRWFYEYKGEKIEPYKRLKKGEKANFSFNV